jgi:hypothetical protein
LTYTSHDIPLQIHVYKVPKIPRGKSLSTKPFPDEGNMNLHIVCTERGQCLSRSFFLARRQISELWQKQFSYLTLFGAVSMFAFNWKCISTVAQCSFVITLFVFMALPEGFTG